MDSRERVEAALRQERSDRVPFGAWGHSFREEWSPAALAEVTVGRARRYQWDFVKFQPRASTFAEAFGGEYRPSGTDTQAPTLVKAPVATLADWAQIQPVDAGAPSLADQVESIGLVCQALGPRVPVIQTVFSPLTVAGYLAGRDSTRVVDELREHPEIVGPALDRIVSGLVDFSRRSVEAGAAGIFYAISGYASRDMMSRDEYEDLVLPFDLAVLGQLPEPAWFNVAHLCGPRLHFELGRLLPTQAVSWSVHEAGNPSLKAGAAAADKAVMGGIDNRDTILRGTPDDVARECHHAITSTDGRGFLLAPGCSIPPEAPQHNIEAITSAVMATAAPTSA